MKLTVNLCGESLFTWEGANSSIDKLSTELEALAAATGHSGMTIADNVLRSVGKARLPTEKPAGRGAMAWITYRLLHTDTNHPAHPNKYADYAPAWHFEFNLVPRADDKGMQIEVLGDTFAGLT
jgi:hypothetical protein